MKRRSRTNESPATTALLPAKQGQITQPRDVRHAIWRALGGRARQAIEPDPIHLAIVEDGVGEWTESLATLPAQNSVVQRLMAAYSANMALASYLRGEGLLAGALTDRGAELLARAGDHERAAARMLERATTAAHAQEAANKREVPGKADEVPPWQRRE